VRDGLSTAYGYLPACWPLARLLVRLLARSHARSFACLPACLPACVLLSWQLIIISMKCIPAFVRDAFTIDCRRIPLIRYRETRNPRLIRSKHAKQTAKTAFTSYRETNSLALRYRSINITCISFVFDMLRKRPTVEPLSVSMSTACAEYRTYKHYITDVSVMTRDPRNVARFTRVLREYLARNHTETSARNFCR